MKITIHQIVHYKKYDWEDAPTYTLHQTDMSTVSPDYIPMCEVDIEVEIPDNFDPRPHQIAALRAAKSKVLAEAHVRAENIEEQIQRLLCIENKSEST